MGVVLMQGSMSDGDPLVALTDSTFAAAARPSQPGDQVRRSACTAYGCG